MKTRVVSCTLLLSGLLLPALATAQAASAPAGNAAWTGVDTVKGVPSSVRVTQKRGAPATARAPAQPDTLEIALGKPRDCRLEARLVARGAQQARYEIIGSSARQCDVWMPGQAVLDTDDTQARLQLSGTGSGLDVTLWALTHAPDTVTAPTALDGPWTTQVTSRAGRPVALRLQLAGRDPGDLGSRLAYGTPRNCNVSLRYEGSTGDGAWYAVRNDGNGGAACNDLLNRWLVVQAGGDAASLRFEPAHAECTPTCSLTRPEP